MRYGWLGIAVATIWWLVASPAEAAAGESLFLTHCARCHGAEGRGNGPDSAGLDPPAADLTRLGEKFGTPVPRVVIAEIIDGRRWALAHGPREMPVWGDVFSGGYPPSPGVETSTRRIIEVLTDYVLTLQPLQPASLE